MHIMPASALLLQNCAQVNWDEKEVLRLPAASLKTLSNQKVLLSHNGEAEKEP